MNIKENIPLAPYTTFKIGGPARYFCAVENEDELVEAVNFAQNKKLPLLVIGGGSNVLISDTGFNGLVIRMEIIREVTPPEKEVLVTAVAGEDWDEFVGKTVEEGLYGLENLSSIPGTVGASPVQNIGAYGVDVSNVISSVRALDTTTMKFVELSNTDCCFSYRHSRFKDEKGRFIITAVTYKLSRDGKVDINYKDLKEYFEKKDKQRLETGEGIDAINRPPSSMLRTPTLQEVRQAVIEIRRNKLPDWKQWGTAGSFFKNPIIGTDKFKELKNKYPEMPGFPETDGRVKVSLGWILDKLCNAKGMAVGNVGTYEKQALVVVAKPGATAAEVVDFTQGLMNCVKEKTGIEIEAEVEWVVA